MEEEGAGDQALLGRSECDGSVSNGRNTISSTTYLCRENDILKEQLLCLGYAVPKTNYALKLANDSHLDEVAARDEQAGARIDGMQQLPNDHNATSSSRANSGFPNGYSSDRTLSGPATNFCVRSDATATQDDVHSSGKKRKRAEYLESQSNMQAEAAYKHKPSSSGLMPPPALPLSRRPSNRAEHDGDGRMLADHNRHESNRTTHPTTGRINDPALQIYENGRWHSVKDQDHKRSAEGVHGSHTATRSHSSLTDNTHPAATFHLDKDTNSSTRDRGGVNPPFNLPAQVQSYERGSGERESLPFLQPLQRFNRSLEPHVESSRAQGSRYFANTAAIGRGPERLATYAHDHYVDNGAQPYRHTLKPPNTEPVLDREALGRLPTRALRNTALPATAARAYPTPSSRMFPERDQYLINPRTPPPRRHFESHGLVQGEPVASPFFESRTHQIPSSESMRVLQQDNPATEHSPMQGYRMARASTHWNEPRGINGLSFISEPYTHSGQPIYQNERFGTAAVGSHRPLMVPPTPRNEQGFFQRPDIPPSSSYAAQHVAPVSRHRYSYVRQAAPLPSAMPSVPVKLHPAYSARTSTRHDALSTIRGAKSSQTVSPHRGRRDPYVQPESFIRRDQSLVSRGLFSSAGGRRSVRR